MDTRTFLGLEPTGAHTDVTGRWSLVVRSAVVTGSKFLFGGAAHGAAVSAMADPDRDAMITAAITVT